MINGKKFLSVVEEDARCQRESCQDTHMSVNGKKNAIFTRRQYFWVKFRGWIFLFIAIIILIIAYTKWSSMNSLEKTLMTIAEIFFTSFSFSDIKDQFKSYERYKSEME
jgi:hypothetical protein